MPPNELPAILHADLINDSVLVLDVLGANPLLFTADDIAASSHVHVAAAAADHHAYRFYFDSQGYLVIVPNQGAPA